MQRCFAVVLLAAVAGCDPTGNDPAAATHLMGNWLSASGNVEVEIARCEPQGKPLCGTIARVLSNQSMSGSGQSMGARDDKGLQILIGFVPGGDDTFRGRILNRENGKIYDCIVSLGAADEMLVRPYVLFPLFGQTQIWHRLH
jgi:uncharacterized protein (DUF2147 family)